LIELEAMMRKKDEEIENMSLMMREKDISIGLMQNSLSWKLTWPLRYTKAHLRSFVRLTKKAYLILKRDGPVLFVKKVIKKTGLLPYKVKTHPVSRKTEIKPIKTVFYISNIQLGGSKKYIDDLIGTFETANLQFSG